MLVCISCSCFKCSWINLAFPIFICSWVCASAVAFLSMWTSVKKSCFMLCCLVFCSVVRQHNLLSLESELKGRRSLKEIFFSRKINIFWPTARFMFQCSTDFQTHYRWQSICVKISNNKHLPKIFVLVCAVPFGRKWMLETIIFEKIISFSCWKWIKRKKEKFIIERCNFLWFFWRWNSNRSRSK